MYSLSDELNRTKKEIQLFYPLLKFPKRLNENIKERDTRLKSAA